MTNEEKLLKELDDHLKDACIPLEIFDIEDLPKLKLMKSINWFMMDDEFLTSTDDTGFICSDFNDWIWNYLPLFDIDGLDYYQEKDNPFPHKVIRYQTKYGEAFELRIMYGQGTVLDAKKVSFFTGPLHKLYRLDDLKKYVENKIVELEAQRAKIVNDWNMSHPDKRVK